MSTTIQFGAEDFPKLPSQEPPPLFQPLDALKGQIRLVRLLPSTWSDDHIRSSTWAAEQPQVEIECSLHVISPEDDLYKSYNALSYAWGDITTQGTAWIRADGLPIEISTNLHEAMKALQSNLDAEWNRRVEADPTTKALPQDYLWIDHLCINQRDLEEKSSQVSMMRDIYANAFSVVGWIGVETEGARRVWDLVTKLLACYRDNLNDNQALDEQALAILKSRGNHIQDATDLADLFDRPYFKRIWIVQEYSSNQNAYILCGQLSIGGGELWAVQGIISGFYSQQANNWHRAQVRATKDPGLRKYLEDALYSRGPRMLQQTRNALLSDDSYEAGWVLWLMQVHRWRIGSDPRDKVFAIAGLFKLKDKIVQPLPVDYRRPTAIVYVDMMKTCMTQTMSMKIWRYLTGHQSRIENLPSWAVDWSDHTIDHLVMREDQGHGADCPCQCDASHNGDCKIYFDIVMGNEGEMRIDGTAIGRVTEVSAKHLMRRQGSDRDMLREFHEWLPLVTKSPGEEMDKLHALGRSILQGLTGDLGSDLGKKRTRETLYILINMSRHYFPEVALTQYLSESLLTMLDEEFGDSVEDLQADHVHLSMWDASIAYCAEQNTFGKVPAMTEAGDILVVCFGSPLVMVFREQPDGSYTVVGPSYFNSFMDGQATKLVASGKLEVKTFLLR